MTPTQVILLLARGFGDAGSDHAEYLARLWSDYKVWGKERALKDARDRMERAREAKETWKRNEYGYLYNQQIEALYAAVIRVITQDYEFKEV